MYIHIGGEHIVRTEEIIGFFDMDTATVSRNTKKTLQKSETQGKLVNCSRDIPKSFILCKERLVISDLNPATLKGRLQKEAGALKETDQGLAVHKISAAFEQKSHR